MEIIKQAQSINSKMEANRIGRDYINIIDTLKLDKNIHETAHSRILKEFLSLGKQYDYPFLKLFFATIGLEHLQNIKPQFFECERHNIDIFIGGKLGEKKYGIIIENKINYASDQDKQIKRYIDIAKNQYSYDANNIYVLYLIRHHGHYLPQEYSISTEERIILESKNQFKQISYEKEIVTFLSNILTTWNNESIKSAVHQYRDYIYTLVNINPNEKELKEVDKDALYSSLGYSLGEQGNTEKLIHFLNQIKEIETVTNEAIQQEIIYDIEKRCEGQLVKEESNEYRVLVAFKNIDINLKLRFLSDPSSPGYALCQKNNTLVDHKDNPISQDLDKKIKFFFNTLWIKKVDWSNESNHSFCWTNPQNAVDDLVSYQNTVKSAIEWVKLYNDFEIKGYQPSINEQNEFIVLLPYQDGSKQKSITLAFSKEGKRLWYGIQNTGQASTIGDENKNPIDEKINKTIISELQSFANERGSFFDCKSPWWFWSYHTTYSNACNEFIEFVEKTQSLLPK